MSFILSFFTLTSVVSIESQCMKKLRHILQTKAISYCVITNHVISRRSKPLGRHNLPRKLASKLLCIRGSRRESKRKQRLSLLFKRVSFLKNTGSFSLFPFICSGASNLGKIYANFSREMVTSSSVLDHRVVEFAKSARCDFSFTRLAFQKISVDHKCKSSQENDTKLR